MFTTGLTKVALEWSYSSSRTAAVDENDNGERRPSPELPS